MDKKKYPIPIKNLFYMLCYAWNVLAIKDDIKIVEAHFEDISADAAKKLTQKLVEEPQAQVTVFYKQKNRLNYQVSYLLVNKCLEVI